VGGLLASTFHLGNPQRAWRAMSQWRTSWLSREGVMAIATLLMLAPVALSDWLGLGWSRLPGVIGAIMALVTVFTTSMIYAQLKTVPRWNHWVTPAMFLCFALAGGAILAMPRWPALALVVVMGLALVLSWSIGDRRFAEVGQTMGKATGLDRIGKPSIFDPAHTAGNYLLHEMIHIVGRKHVARLRVLALIFAVVLPALALALLPGAVLPRAVAAVAYLIGAFAARWLFFAQAEHVVGLYYGKR
jgi:DMSO reductase anchor subunit